MDAINLRNFIPPKAERVLEFGCHNGEYALFFKQMHPKSFYTGVYGDEVNDEARVQIQNACDQILHQSMLIYKDNIRSLLSIPVDCMLYREGIRPFTKNKETFFQQLRSLKSEGQVICKVENPLYIKNLFSNHCIEEYSLPQLMEMFNDAGVYIYDIKPYFNKNVQQLLQDRRIQSAAALLSNAFGEGNKNETLFAEGFVLRGVKGKKPDTMFLQAVLGETVVCSRVRIEEPHLFSETIPGVKGQLQDLQQGEKFMFVTATPVQNECRVIIRQRSSLDKVQSIPYLKAVLKHQYLAIAEMDDDPLRWKEMHENNDFIGFRGVHAVQVSTEPLKRFMEKYNPNVKVFQNHLRFLLPRKKQNKEKPIIFFGALNREGDWAPVMPVLNKILQKYQGKVQVYVIYDQNFFAALQTEDKTFFPLLPYVQYMQVMYQSDLAVLPLADTHFNRMKSDLKYIECAGAGVTVLASSIVYADTIQDGCTGMIYCDLNEFEEKLERLLTQPILRQTIADAAYHYVKTERMLYQHYEERYAWYKQLYAELPRLNLELTERVNKICGVDLFAE